MRCPQCQRENRSGRRFCAECGAPLPFACPACGFTNEPGEKFCGGCGTPLAGPAAQPPQPAQHPAQPAVPRHQEAPPPVARVTPEAERRQLTVLFCDLVDSTVLASQLDPEELREVVRAYQETCAKVIARFDGHIPQYLGDGLLVYFGYPLAHEDDAQRAVRAIGNDLHMDYSAVGQTTHLAARMEQLATPGSSLLTAATLRLVEGLVRVQALGPVPVKGLADPVEVFELVGATALRRRLQVAVARRLSPFVGRQPEVEALQQALARAGAGQGQVVALIGEPGVGKSRLVYEFLHSHRTQGWLQLESSSVSYGKATAYLPVCDLLKAYGHLEDRNDLRTVRAKITGQILTLDDALQDTVPAVLALFEALPADSPFLQLDPLQRRRRTLEGLKRVLLRESQVQPLLLVFEDLHWIDTETQAVLDMLVESLPTAKVLLLVNYRPEYQHGWGSKTYYTQLRLDPLPEASAEEFLQALLGDDGGARQAVPLQDLKRLLIARTQGNPFFLEESVRTLVETGVLVGDRGAYHLAQPLDTLQVPATVQALLAAHIDRLPPEDKRLLQTAAVMGTEVPWPLLQAIAELPEAALYQLGVVQAHADPPDAAPAEAHYQQALTLAEELGMRPLMAHCHLGLGTLYANLARREEARAALAAAIALYRAMEMTCWLPLAEAALSHVG